MCIVRLLFASLLVTSVSGTAQGQVPAGADSTLTAASSADSVAAVHRLFAAKRKACGLVIGGTATVTGIGALSVLNGPSPARNSFGGIDGRPIMATMIVIAALPVMGAELLFCGGWGRREEARAIAALQAHQPPRYLQRKLKPKYFLPNR